MGVLDKLEPQKVFSFFEELCAIPHGSGNTKKVCEWLLEFAKKRGFEHYSDELNNVIIIKEATKGYENSEPVILQGHTDMVCEKASDCEKDMENEGLDLAIDGDFIYAKGTTLGGDDGFAVAVMLAILDSDDLEHPRVEAIFTVDEEIGMFGAEAIDLSMLKGKRMLNMDSEDEGIFTVSCAGGNVTKCILPVVREDFDGKALKIKISGLMGGHSGVEINKGRANSNALMGRVLYALSKACDMRVISVNGGLKDNAIPCETNAVVCVSDEAKALQVLDKMQTDFENEYRVTDSRIKISTEVAQNEKPMNKDCSEKVIFMLCALPNGIEAMSADIEGLVQTSLNLGVFKTLDDEVVAGFCVRSSKESQKEMLSNRLEAMMSCIGGSIEISGDYPGWDYREDSPLRDLMIEVFTSQYGKEPKIEAIHAGLECGILAAKIPGLDCVSFGPDLKEIHTCRERMSVSSVERVWKMVVEILKRMK